MKKMGVELFGAQLKGLGIVALDHLVETVAVAGEGRLGGGQPLNGHQPGLWGRGVHATVRPNPPRPHRLQARTVHRWE